jgi:DNA-binding HxlR family transcriptional regulator
LVYADAVTQRPAADPNRHRFDADSVERALVILGGDRWTFLILREAFFGVRRFSDFARNLGIARNVLAHRLDVLVDGGLFTRVLYNENGPWYEYRLTDAGRGLYGAILALMHWGDEQLAGDEGPPLALHHAACDHDFYPVVACSHCGEALDPREVEPRPGPGATTGAQRRRRAAAPR